MEFRREDELDQVFESGPGRWNGGLDLIEVRSTLFGVQYRVVLVRPSNLDTFILDEVNGNDELLFTAGLGALFPGGLFQAFAQVAFAIAFQHRAISVFT